MLITIFISLSIAFAIGYLFYRNTNRARCSWCNKRKGIDENGICENCLDKIRSREKSRVNKIISNYNIIDSNRKMHVRLAKLDETLAELKKIFIYEDRGIELIKPSAHKRFIKLKEKHDNIIYEASNDKVRNLRERIEKNSSIKEKLAMFNQALLYIVDLKIQLIVKPTLLDELEAALKQEILKLHVRNLVSKGIECEKAGKGDIAIVNYRKATEYIKQNDNNHILDNDLNNILERLNKIAA
ncbi:MAG: hypothetical protein ACLFSQ_03905 [Candidatus Zixiibacteriota bacterium]